MSLATCKGAEEIVGQRAGPAVRIVVSTGDGQTAAAGEGPLDVSALVVDALGTGVSGIQVHFSPGSGGSAAPSAAVSSTGGRVRTHWTLGNVFGTESLSVTAPGLGVATFHAQATIPHVVLATWGADPGPAPPGTVFDSFTVSFHLKDGRPFVNAPVRWAVFWYGDILVGGGDAVHGSVSPFAATTDSNGRTASQATLGNSPTTSVVIGAALLDPTQTRGVAANASFELTWPVPAYFAEIAAGTITTCGLSKTGAASCWGWNAEGEFGNGSAGGQYSGTPTPVGGGLSFSKLAVGDEHACAVTATGALYCWGSNRFGQLGQGSIDTLPHAPTNVPLPEAIDSVVAGWSITCALGVSGQAYCWGDNRAGALGDGTTRNHASPALVATGQRFRQLATVGPFSACGLTPAGSAWCWGDNASGQLGNGSRTAQLSPGLVSGGHAFRALTGSEWHACGLDMNDRAYCWGGNFVGQLGDSTEVDRLTPTLVAGGKRFAALSSGVGREHTCGIAVNGTAFCWGGDLEAELGTGWITDAQLPTCTFSNSFVLCSPVPVSVRLKIPFAAVTTGSSHTCAIAQSGAAYCWGDDTIGSLGDGVSGSVSEYPSVVAIPTGAISATRSAVSRRPRKSTLPSERAKSLLIK